MNIIYFPESSPFIDNVHIKTSIHINLYIYICLMTPEGISIKSHQINIKSPVQVRCFFHNSAGSHQHSLLVHHRIRQWIGLRDHWNRKAPYLMGISIVSCRFSLNPLKIVIPMFVGYIPIISYWVQWHWRGIEPCLGRPNASASLGSAAWEWAQQRFHKWWDPQNGCVISL
jgi:hypothetical protein